MNGEIPSVPITTLAGIASLTDLLPELPLPSPLPASLNNKSLLFHPRVAEEAQRLLNTRDEVLAAQLIQALSQTSAEHIELKDSYATNETIEGEMPELLKTVLQRNPHTFKGMSTRQVTPASFCSQSQPLLSSNTNHNQHSPYPSPHLSPYPSHPSPSRYTPQGSPVHHPPQGSPGQFHAHGSPFTIQQSSLQSNFILPESGLSLLKCQANQSGKFSTQAQPLNFIQENQSVAYDEQHRGDNMVVINAPTYDAELSRLKSGQVNGDALSTPLELKQSSTDSSQLKSKLHARSPAQASIPPITPATPKSCMAAEGKSIDDKNQSLLSTNEIKSPGAITKKRPSVGEPVVVLNKLTEAVIIEQTLAQKSIKEFNLKSPKHTGLDRQINHNAKESHILSPKSRRRGSNEGFYRNNRSVITIKSESDSSEDEPLAEKRRKEKEKQKDKEKIKQKSKEIDKLKSPKRHKLSCSIDHISGKSEKLLNASLIDKAKRRKRSSTQTSYHESPTTSGHCTPSDNSSDELSTSNTIQKKKLKKERKIKKLVDETLTPEELMETNTFKRFTNTLDLIFDSAEDVDLAGEQDEDAEIPPEALIPKYQLTDLTSEAAKLKKLGAMEQIPSERLVKLLSILERNIRDGAKVIPIQNPDEQDEEEGKLWLELTMERVIRSVDASLTSMYIMTSPCMPKQVFLEDVIERVVTFVKYQLQNTIFPVFDPVYRTDPKSKDGYVGNIKQKRAKAREVKHKLLIQLYNKLHELVGLLAELLDIQVMTDTIVLQVSTLGVSPFFVENVSELQLSALRLVTTVFAKYEKHRQLILEDILASLARLPTSKRSMRNYRLNSEEHIQMVTALILQLIQCVVQLPRHEDENSTRTTPHSADKKPKKEDGTTEEKEKPEMDKDVFIITSYEMAIRTAVNFLSVFLKKCSGKNDELDYRPLFENFIQDLLTTVNKPEWPATELLLSLLGRLLVQNFSNKSLDMSLRVASLDYLGVVAARLRKDAVSSQLKQDTIDEIIKQITSNEDDDLTPSKNSKKPFKKEKITDSEEKNQILQKALLDYLSSNMQSDPALQFARQFYIAQWFRDANAETIKDKDKRKDRDKMKALRPPKSKFKKKRRRKDNSSEEEEEEEEEEDEEDDQQSEEKNKTDENIRLLQLAEKRKQFLRNTIKTTSSPSRLKPLESKLDYESAELISRFLASKRQFSQSFDIYLSQILRVLNESAIAVRTKAMKCLTLVVEADPGILARADMQHGVHGRFLDHSTSVREAAVDLVGKFVLIRPELTNQYYDMLIERILDTGVSVRKRVIKILKDICLDQPDFPKIPEICVKMIRRVNDEEGIKKLVNEVFQNMWFTPIKNKDSAGLLRRVMNITDVVTACKDSGLDWFEQLLQNLLKAKEDKEDVSHQKQVLLACQQIVDCLVENLLQLEEKSLEVSGQGTSQRLVSCLTTLYLFAKIKPQLLVNHATTLQPYLSLKCSTQGDCLVLHNVARTLELVVPLLDHPSETFLAQLEEDMMKLILRHGMMVIQSCISCLGAVVNYVTHNYKLVRDCFQKFFTVLQKIKTEHEHNPNNPVLVNHRPTLMRSLFTVGLLCRHFNFDSDQVMDGKFGFSEPIRQKVYDVMLYFMKHEDEEVRHKALTGIGFCCIRHYDMMLQTELKDLYNTLLLDESASIKLKCQVLRNLQTYLQEEEIRMIKQDSEWQTASKKEDIKEMGDITSGMASTIIQIYLKHILESFMHPNTQVRTVAMQVIQLILSQGLVHPVQIVPYLICMSTDIEPSVRTKSDQQLQEIEKKYPGFIQMKAVAGVKMSYKLHKIINQSGSEILRGFRPGQNPGDAPVGFNGFLYSVVRGTRQHRRAFVLSLLKQFDEQNKTPLSELLYVADNLAYFPYQTQDEALFVIHHIDIIISVSGSNLLQSFKEITSSNRTELATHLRPEGLLPSNSEIPSDQLNNTSYYDDDDDDDLETLMNRLPDDTSALQNCIVASQGCLLLLMLKQHLKEMYCFTDSKIHQYSPAETVKVYEKSLNRKSNARFMPKATLEALKEGTPPSKLDDDARRDLVQQYLDFKELMLSIDRGDDDDEDDDIKPTRASAHNKSKCESGEDTSAEGVTLDTSVTVKIDENDKSNNTVLSPSGKHKDSANSSRHKTVVNIKSRSKSRTPKIKEKTKKKPKKKRRKCLDSEDSNSDSDPDFTT